MSKLLHAVRTVLPAVVVVAAAAVGVTYAGPVTWSPGEGGNGNSYEVFFDTDRDWNAAAAAATAAAAAGGDRSHLLTVTSAPEQAFVARILEDADAPTGGYWIGLQETTVENQYAWVTGEPLTYTNWDGGEPNNGVGGENVGGILWTVPPEDPLFPRRALWNDFPVSGYPAPQDNTPGHPDLFRAGYIVETEASPAAIPLPAAVYAFPLGAALVSYCGYRARRRR